jgi:enoyl-CoA hydratase
VLRVERVDACAVWTIDRPQAKNALDFATFDALRRAAEAAAADASLRAVVLTGAGDTFVSGGDLRELKDALSAEDGERLAELGSDLMLKLEALPVPVIAALPGPAIGGGAELAVACDLRVADARARVSFKQVRMGVTTAWGTIARLTALVGRGTAARLLYTAHDVGAADAKGLGLVDEVAPDGTCREVALAWARDIALASPAAVAGMKTLLAHAARAPDTIAVEERRRFVATWAGADHAEAVNAYFARRAPAWSKG